MKRLIKKNTTLFLTVIVLMLITVIGTSYAVLRHRLNYNNEVIETDYLSVTYSSGSSMITGDIFAMSNADGLAQTGYSFTINNQSTSYYVDYKVSIHNNPPANFDGSLVDPQYIWVGVNGEAVGKLSELDSYTENNVVNYILDTGIIPAGDTKNYTINVWLDDNTPNTEGSKYVYLQLKVEGEATHYAFIPGLYDDNDKLLISYDNLVTNFNFNPSLDQTANDMQCKYIDGDCYYKGHISKNIIGKFTNASKLVLPEGLEKIGDYAFAFNSLKEIIIPDSVKSIGKSAFYNPRNLKVLNIPNGITTIGDNYAFYNISVVNYTGSLTSNNNWGAKALNSYIDGDYAYADESKTRLIAYLGDYTDDVIIPDTVTTIEDNAFNSVKGTRVIGLTIPNSVTSIGKEAFASTSIGFIDVPDSVTSIGESAFQSSTYVAVNYTGPLTVPSNKWGAYYFNVFRDGDFVYRDQEKTQLLTYIGKSLDIIIPNNVTNIVADPTGMAFMYMKNKYNSITIPNTTEKNVYGGFNGVKIVYHPGHDNRSAYSSNCFNPVVVDGDWAYYDVEKTKICTYIGTSNNIVIPNYIKEIGTMAFDGFKINSIAFESNSQLEVLGNGSFQYVTWGETPVFPNSVKTIGYQAFGNSNLYKFTFPSSLEVLNERLFTGNYVTELDITNLTHLKTIENEAFAGTYIYTGMTVPSSVTTIRKNAFKYADFTSVTFANSNNWYRNGVLLDVTDPVANITALKDSNNTDWTRTE